MDFLVFFVYYVYCITLLVYCCYCILAFIIVHIDLNESLTPLPSPFTHVQMCFEWFTKGQHDLESDVQQQLFKEKILKLEPYEITMNGEKNYIGFVCMVQFFGLKVPSFLPSGFNLFKTFFENVNLCDHRLKRQGTQLVSPSVYQHSISDQRLN